MRFFVGILAIVILPCFAFAQYELIEAVTEGNLEETKALLTNGADINQVNELGFQPISSAFSVGIDNKIRLELIRYLLSNGADINAKYDGWSLAWIAYQRMDIDVLNLLIKEGADLESLNPQTKEKLIDKIVNLAKEDVKVRQAIQFFPENICNHLALVNLKMETDLAKKWALKKGQYPSELLFNATICKNEPLVKKLIDNGSDVNVQNSTGDTPLHLAMFYQVPEIINLLVNKGADIDVKNKNNISPFDDLVFGLSTGEKETQDSAFDILQSIFLNKMDTPKFAEKKMQLIGLIIQRCDLPEFKTRIQQGLEVTGSDKEGMNALMTAAYYNKKDIFDYINTTYPNLISKKDKNGRNILDYAILGNTGVNNQSIFHVRDKEFVAIQVEDDKTDNFNEYIPKIPFVSYLNRLVDGKRSIHLKVVSEREAFNDGKKSYSSGIKN